MSSWGRFGRPLGPLFVSEKRLGLQRCTKRRHHGYKLTFSDTFWRVIFNIFAIIFLMCFRGRFLSELGLILESFLELFWGTFCNLLVHCAEMCIFRKSSPLSAFCLVFEVLASRRGVFFHRFSGLVCGLLRGRVSDLVFIDLGLHFGPFWGPKSKQNGSKTKETNKKSKKTL